jgi:hypothetical protein
VQTAPILTREIVLNDIKQFQARISSAQSKLDQLPGGHLAYHEHRKRELARKGLLDDIIHFRRLCSYAMEALNEPDRDPQSAN